MKKTSKIVVLALILVMMFTMTVGCATGEVEQPVKEAASAEEVGPIRIGCAIQGNQSTFMQFVVSGMYKYAEENPDLVVIDVVYAEDDASKQITQVETLLQEGIDVLVLNPVDPDACVPAVEACVDEGIPVITVNTTVNSDQVASHVGSDDVNAGRIQLERIIEVVGENARIGYVNAVIGHSAQVGRETGYKEVLAENPGVELVASDTANWSGDETMALVENWLMSGKEFDAILCQADCQLVGAIVAVEDAGKIGEIKLTGMDCTDDVMTAIADGKVDSSIWQDGVGQGYHAVRIAVEAANGVAVEDYMIPFEVCSQENYEDYFGKIDERNKLAAEHF